MIMIWTDGNLNNSNKKIMEGALYSFMHVIKYKEMRVREDWSGRDAMGLK